MADMMTVSRVQKATEKKAGNMPVNTVHLLLAIIMMAKGRAWSILREAELKKDSFARMRKEDHPFGEKDVIDIVYEAGKRVQVRTVFQELLLVFMLQELLEHQDCSAYALLEERHTMPISTMCQVIEKYLPRKEIAHQFRASPARGLEPLAFLSDDILPIFGEDLTLRASRGDLDPVIGRDAEIASAIRILCNRRKNNPVFVGDAGVGKTAIVEGLADALAQMNDCIPVQLQGCRIFSLNLSKIVAGTKWRGDFEDRIVRLITEIVQRTEVIPFFDEVHTLIGAGSGSGTLDASNIMKPYLARGELQCIGATTLDEYRKYIEQDDALRRRFKMVLVDEPDQDNAIAMLRSQVALLERHHRVHIADDAVSAAVEMSMRYVADGKLPDKALDLLDEASSAVGLRSLRSRQVGRVVPNDVGTIVRKLTGIRVCLSAEELHRSTRLAGRLNRRVIQQERAIETVVSFVNGISLPRKPIASFMFLGPTGVGKTELALALAEELFGTEEALFVLDMTQYAEPFMVSRLIGAPPGYIGYDEGGQLTGPVRRRPYSVVLLDEIEKAHSDVFNMLLQILDEGRLTDSKGRTVNFKNTVIIMTANITPQPGIGFGSNAETSEQAILDALKKKGFRDEFLNRVDAFVLFDPLGKCAANQILELRLAEAEDVLAGEGVEIQVSAGAKKLLVDLGFSEQFGARPLGRIIRRYILNPIGAMKRNGLPDDACVSILAHKGAIVAKHKKAALIPRKKKLVPA